MKDNILDLNIPLSLWNAALHAADCAEPKFANITLDLVNRNMYASDGRMLLGIDLDLHLFLEPQRINALDSLIAVPCAFVKRLISLGVNQVQVNLTKAKIRSMAHPKLKADLVPPMGMAAKILHQLPAYKTLKVLDGYKLDAYYLKKFINLVSNALDLDVNTQPKELYLATEYIKAQSRPEGKLMPATRLTADKFTCVIAPAKNP